MDPGLNLEPWNKSPNLVWSQNNETILEWIFKSRNQTAVDLNTLPVDSGVSVAVVVVVVGVDVVLGVVVAVDVDVAFDLDERSTLKLVTKWDMEVGLSVLVLK